MVRNEVPNILALSLDSADLSSRQKGEARRATIVAQTGWGQEEHRTKSTEVGFDHHFVKPLSPAKIADLLMEVQEKLLVVKLRHRYQAKVLQIWPSTII